MTRTLLRFATTALMSLAIIAAPVGSTAQYARRNPAEGAERNPLSGHLIKTGLYMFSSASGNTLLRLTANGLILVDGQTAAHHEALVAHVSKISEQPVRLLITTDHHPARTANNTQFAASGAQIVAHENVTRHLAAARAKGDTTALPTKTYDGHLSLTLGGIDLRLFHAGRAHTDADSVVYFANLKVVALGDLFAAVPDPDYASGGSLVGWGAALAAVLALDFDVAVPATGQPVTKVQVAGFKTKIDTLVARAAALVKQGVPKAQLMARLETADLGWHLAFTPAQVDGFYAELTRAN